MIDELLLAVTAEVDRIGAGIEAIGPEDALVVNDELEGWASLGASAERRDLYWYGRLEDLLERLEGLPAGGGREVVVAELRSRYPGSPGTSSAL